MSKGILKKEATPLVYGLAVLAIFLAVSSPRVTEARWVRDVRGVTAFDKVRVHHTATSKGDVSRTLQVTGELRKVRCEKLSHVVHTKHFGEAYWRYAQFKSLEGPEVPVDRLASKDSESFGPWQITALTPAPLRARMSTRHACPSKDDPNAVFQDNVVFDVEWQNFKRKYQGAGK